MYRNPLMLHIQIWKYEGFNTLVVTLTDRAWELKEKCFTPWEESSGSRYASPFGGIQEAWVPLATEVTKSKTIFGVAFSLFLFHTYLFPIPSCTLGLLPKTNYLHACLFLWLCFLRSRLGQGTHGSSWRKTFSNPDLSCRIASRLSTLIYLGLI